MTKFEICFVFSLLAGLLGGCQSASNDDAQLGVQVLENDTWSVGIAPELGGKIYSLKDKISGREWMWSRSEGRELLAPKDGEGFGYGNLMGADELLPTLAGVEWNGRQLPPHGELWRSPVRVVARTSDSLETQIDLVSLPLRYTRSVSLEGRDVTLRYQLENIGDEPVPYLWAWHPLFDLLSGDRLELDPASSLEVMVAPGVVDVDAGDTISWPGDEVGIDLNALYFGEVPKAGMKWFMDSPVDGKLRLSNVESGATIALRYKVEALPYLAFWLSRGVWGGAHHLAIEPTNRPNEVISPLAPAEDPDGWLQPGEVREWWLILTNESTPLS